MPTGFSVAATALVSLTFLIGCEQSKVAPAPSPAAEQAATSKPEPPTCTDCVLVTAQNFPRAETDLTFSRLVKEGSFGKFVHNREPTAIDKQNVVRIDNS